MSAQSFAHALLEPTAALPSGVIGPDGLPDEKRFSVYRNNVASSLTRALEAAFPVVRQLVGAEFFAGLARTYLRAHPPRDRRLMLYGDRFPAFLHGFAPVQHLGYLPDVARLEQALRESYHAADSMALPPKTLASMSEAELLQARFQLAPTLRLIASPWPIHGIWAAHAQGGPSPKMQAEEVAILRPGFDPVPYLLPTGGVAFLSALQRGAPLVAALAETGEGFDLTALLGQLLRGEGLIGVSA